MIWSDNIPPGRTPLKKRKAVGQNPPFIIAEWHQCCISSRGILPYLCPLEGGFCLRGIIMSRGILSVSHSSNHIYSTLPSIIIVIIVCVIIIQSCVGGVGAVTCLWRHRSDRKCVEYTYVDFRLTSLRGDDDVIWRMRGVVWTDRVNERMSEWSFIMSSGCSSTAELGLQCSKVFMVF